MSQTATDMSIFPIDASGACTDVAAFADSILQTLRVARALVVGGRVVSLDGLDDQIAQLCARCLGLAPQDGRSMRLHLMALRAELEATTVLLDARQAPTPCPPTIS